MKHLRTLTRGVLEGAALLLLIGALQACNGCATAQVKRNAYDTLATTQTVLEAAQRFEIAQVCGREGAPPEGLCVPLATHKAIQADFLTAAELGQQITAIARSVPAGQPTPGQALDLALKLKRLVEKILAMLPKSEKADALKAQLEGK